MSDTALIFSIVFFAVFAVYFFFAIYILNISIRVAQNLIFFAVCIALCIWSFGYAMFLSAPAGATCADLGARHRRWMVYALLSDSSFPAYSDRQEPAAAQMVVLSGLLRARRFQHACFLGAERHSAARV